MENGVIIQQILILTALVLIGILATKTGIITPAVKEGLAGLIFNITLPALILSGISRMELTNSLLNNGFFALFIIFLLIMIMAVLGMISARYLHLPEPSASVHMTHTMFGNIVYLGFPLINSLFPGGDALFYAILFHLVSSFIMWTLGVYLLGRNNNKSVSKGILNLLNPNTFAFFLGFLLLIFKIQLPVYVEKPLSGLGNTTIYLSMFYIGAMLYSINWRKALVSKASYILSLNKLLLVPVIAMILFISLAHLFSIHPDEKVFFVIILESGMPAMANIVVLARIFGADDVMATQNVFISTLLSLITLPLLLYVLHYVVRFL